MLKQHLPLIIRPKEEIIPPSGVLQQLLLLPALPSNSSNNQNLVIIPQQNPVSAPEKLQKLPQKSYFSSVKGYTVDNQEVGPICRTCYRVVYNSNFIKLSHHEKNEISVRIRNMLKQIVRTIDLEIYPEPIICTKCMKQLFECHQFLTKCWDTEVKFNHWMTQRKRVKQEEVNLLILVENSTDSDILEEPVVGKKPPKHVKVTKKKPPKAVVDLTVNEEVENFVKAVPSFKNLFMEEHSYAWSMQVPPKPKKRYNYKVKLSKAERMRRYRAKNARKRGPFLCELCGYLAKSLASFSFHVAEHENDRITVMENSLFKCDKCPFLARCPKALQKHAVGHSEPRYKCTECGKSYRVKRALQSHIKNIHSNNPDSRQCHICGKSFKYRTSLRVHLLHVHNPDKPRRCVCEFCGKGFVNPSQYRKHLLSHSSQSYTCEICGKQLKRKKSLQTHLKIYHQGGWKFTCEVCKRSFWNNENLVNHRIRHHTAGHEKKCDSCQVYFCNRTKFAKHFVEVHGQSIECEVCRAKFKHEWSLRNHFNMQHGDAPRFKCEICGKGFWKERALENHRVKVHGVEVEQEEILKSVEIENSDVIVEDFNLDKGNVLVEPIEVLGFY